MASVLASFLINAFTFTAAKQPIWKMRSSELNVVMKYWPWNLIMWPEQSRKKLRKSISCSTSASVTSTLRHRLVKSSWWGRCKRYWKRNMWELRCPQPVIFNLGCTTPEGLWTIFEGSRVDISLYVDSCNKFALSLSWVSLGYTVLL